MSSLRDRAVIAGVAQTPCAKDLGEDPLRFTVRTCLQALDDAGISVDQVDGVAAMGTEGEPPVFAMIDALGLPGVKWYGGALGGGVGPSVVANAALAVASGQCDTVIAYRTMTAPRPGPSVYNFMGEGAGLAEGNDAFLHPYGLGLFMQYFAPWYQRRKSVYGVTEEQMGAYVVAMRENASRHPLAALGEPISLDDYLESRYVCEPLRLFDCDLPVDVCGAVVVTRADRAADLRHPAVYVSAVSTGTGPRPDMIYWHDYDQSASHWAAQTIWNRAGMGPDDMDFAMIYDGFAPLVLYGLEEFGFVPPGEAGEFLGRGEHLRSGSLPLNPHGGNNSQGRSHAIGHVVEAALQLRGQAGARQLPGVNTTFINGGAITLAGAMVLHN